MIHVPIFLQYTGFIDGVNLSWSNYKVQGTDLEFSGYSVYKGSDSLQLTPLEENIPLVVSVYIDKDLTALENRYFYRVAGILSEPCFPSGGSLKANTGPYNHSLSNMDDNKLKTGTEDSFQAEAGLTLYPNPASEQVTLRFSNPASSGYRLKVYNISGKLLNTYGRIYTGEFSFSVSDLPTGYYQLVLEGEKVFRKTLIIK